MVLYLLDTGSLFVACLKYWESGQEEGCTGELKSPVLDWAVEGGRDDKNKRCNPRNGLSTTKASKMSNIFIMGPPGAGKTTVSKRIAEALSLKLVDVDDDLLEGTWKCKVSDKLKELGEDGFLQEEGRVLQTLQVEDSVVSLTGSNPLIHAAMEHIKSSGFILYLDASEDDILERLERMKVDRIVGSSTRPMRDVLAYRRTFYEKYYDVRALLPRHADLDQTFNICMENIRRYREVQLNEATFVSTRSDEPSKGLTFGEAVLRGLSPDGGLFVPRITPEFASWEWERFAELIARDKAEGYVVSDVASDSRRFQSLALRLIERWAPEIPVALSRQFIQNAYQFPSRFDTPEVAPVVDVGDNRYMLELFHGPTASLTFSSFKDFALQLFPQIFRHYAGQLRPNTHYAILVSTSGDTGSATVHGFCEQTDIPVLCLYPEDGVSPVQKFQMVTSPSKNLSVMGVRSDFDFCQTSIKSIFNDQEFTSRLSEMNVQLSAANSINWGRLLPQVFYHTWAYLSLVNRGAIKMGDKVDICVPTGNFGNILSALYARNSGLPIRKLICAANENDVLTEFLTTGVYDIRTRNLKKTASPSIDILKSSNLERLLFILTPLEERGKKISDYYSQLDREKYFKIDEELRKTIDEIFWSGSCSDAQTKETITSVYKERKIILDPHTAVAMHVAREYRKAYPESKSVSMIVCSTAHYSKFPRPVLESIGVQPEEAVPAQIRQLQMLNPEPQMHEMVLLSVNAESLHQKVCGEKIEDIKGEVEGFLRGKYGR
ncbi:threonine synthase-like 1 [Planoprotostelium fungivorum]|uniref:Threonine synthase-like 1 n=1 Tax=Planoprotostelium fungivorum TaxID=1890364 RepID=A0A2P6N7F5_9EUKA|nr:threonine synthase-like 1 [Planoprotostelium fungivorum]